jgi:hypothetical protein
MVAFPFSSKLSRKGPAGCKADNPGARTTAALAVMPAFKTKHAITTAVAARVFGITRIMV